MKTVLKYLENVIDCRQGKKILHKMSDIITLVFFASVANADDWVEIELFGNIHERFLRKYLELPNGIPSHDTIERVFAMVSSEFLEKFHGLWNKMLSTNEGQKIRKILSLDGKTQCGTGNSTQKANHIVSAVDENGFCLGEKLVHDKSNEITAIPALLDDLNIKGNIITTDAMGTQTEIVKKIRKKRADYLLAVKGNQGTLHEDIKLYFDDKEYLNNCEYTHTIQKEHGGVIKREYWQTAGIDWLPQKAKWMGLKSIVMTQNTFTKGDLKTVETRYFISSLDEDIHTVARAVRGHWMVESYHWHLDVTFREDANRTIEKQAAYNLNIIKKLAINSLKLFEIAGMKLSLKKKRFAICQNVEKYLDMLLNI
jgi:predicted transposase YbfD/YdcC